MAGDAETTERWLPYIPEAAKSFDLPTQLVGAVIHVESAGDPHALSPKGAMGLMQVMPPTWQDLRASHALGDDPFEPRDNILGGAAYLRWMFDRFGREGFLAAYNAGPGRCEEHVSSGRPLPSETRAYVE